MTGRSAMRPSILLAVVILSLAGCATAHSSTHGKLSPRDEDALAEVAPIASSDAAVDGTVTGVDCWTPSRHLLGETATPNDFRVICRVHYQQAENARYKDMICIGDFDATPMLRKCYRWAFYTDMPTFEDGPALSSSPPAPWPGD